MIVPTFTFPIYGIMIVLSLVLGSIFHFYFLKKKQVTKQYIWLWIILVIPFSLYGGILFHCITSRTTSLGLSSYGGLLGMFLAAFLFSKMTGEKRIFFESTVFSLPLIYAIGKIGCHFAGCCFGIPYEGPWAICYPNRLNILVFPVQIAETVSFLGIFILGFFMRERKHACVFIVILCAFMKFLWDYFRYSHLNVFLSVNQIVSIAIIVFCIGALVCQNKVGDA